MSEKESYTKNEMDLKWELVLTKLDAIHEQTKRTNGRVSTLEEYTNSLNTRVSVLEKSEEDHSESTHFWRDKAVWVGGGVLLALLSYIISKL